MWGEIGWREAAESTVKRALPAGAAEGVAEAEGVVGLLEPPPPQAARRAGSAAARTRGLMTPTLARTAGRRKPANAGARMADGRRPQTGLHWARGYRPSLRPDRLLPGRRRARGRGQRAPRLVGR